MQQPTSEYARSEGIRLLEHLVEAHRGLFTAGEAVAMAQGLGVSASHTYTILHHLARSGYLRRLPKGLYVVTSPIAGGAEPHTFAIATHLVQPSVISHWSALQHWGLIDQIPFVVTASSPKVVVTPDMRRPEPSESSRPRRHSAWIIDGLRYEFIRIRSRDMFGIDQVWVDGETQVPMFDRERTLLDAFVQVQRFGVGQLGEEILDERRDLIDQERLIGYAQKMERPRVLARVRAAVDRDRHEGSR
jgi:predicted transcriptional regulator of viral defense system